MYENDDELTLSNPLDKTQKGETIEICSCSLGPTEW